MTENLSRSAVKRQFKQVEQLAAELSDFTENDLKNLPCSEGVKTEIRAIRPLKGGARKRQVKYLAKLIRQEPLTEIYDFLSERKGSALKSKREFHEAERLRDALINEAMAHHREMGHEHDGGEMDWPSVEIEALLARYGGLQELELRKLAYGYVRTRNRGQYRELFRMIKAAIDQDELQRRLV
ncbi:MAG: ribosome biogenesis factor YjgA [Desulfopila sp.]